MDAAVFVCVLSVRASGRPCGGGVSAMIQWKLSSFTSKLSSEASCDDSEANTSTCEAMEEEMED